MMDAKYKEKTDLIFTLLRKCGEEMLAVRDHIRDADIMDKQGPGNFVTVFDLRIQKELIEGLSLIFPEAGFFAEEKENSPQTLKKGLCFLIDPIDGTTNFIHDLHASVISVGLYQDGEPCFGAVYDPYQKEMFYAFRNEGAFLNGRRIHVSSRTFEKSLIAFGSSPYQDRQLSARFFDLLHSVFLSCADIRRGGSAALDLCNVAAGRTDAFFEEQLSPWDYGAGLLIVREAGGVITDFAGKNIPVGEKSAVVCGSEKLHAELLYRIQSSYC